MKEIIPVCLAIVAVASLEIIALINEINGALMALVVSAIVGIGGWEAKAIRDKVKEKKKKREE